MISYDIVNEREQVLRIIIEPESIEYDLRPNGIITVVASGESPAFACKQFVNGDEILCLAFWPDKGHVEILYEGKNIIGIV